MHSGAQLLEVGVLRALGGGQRQDQPVQCLERVVVQVHGNGCTLIEARRDAVFWLGAPGRADAERRCQPTIQRGTHVSLPCPSPVFQAVIHRCSFVLLSCPDMLSPTYQRGSLRHRRFSKTRLAAG